VTVETASNVQGRRGTKRIPERTCVGCGQRDEVSKLVRLVIDDGTSPASPGRGPHLGDAPRRSGDDEAGGRALGLAFDLAGGSFGRGAHLHARPACIAKAPRGIARAFKGKPVDAAELGRLLVEACDRSMAGLLVTARRLGAVAAGTDAALQAVMRGAPLVIVAVDAGTVAGRREVEAAVAEGRAVAWRTRGELGSLLGEAETAICAVRHEGIATRFKALRAAAAAGAGKYSEGEECR
jgi:predicted RNA-binding protein YlxR (DUF448 family)